MGEVYRARDTRLGREVAIKVLPEHLTAVADLRARFEREARTISSLNHPNICVLHDVGRENGTDFLVMELIEGETLAAIGRGPLPCRMWLRTAQIADALERAHRAGVVHRDLKPGNVMITKSGAKLMDFGSRAAEARRRDLEPVAVADHDPAAHGRGPHRRHLPVHGARAARGRESRCARDCGRSAACSTRWRRPSGVRRPSQASLIGAIMRSEPRPIASSRR
jgi:serine/threonine protein kinase